MPYEVEVAASHELSRVTRNKFCRFLALLGARSAIVGPIEHLVRKVLDKFKFKCKTLFDNFDKFS